MTNLIDEYERHLIGLGRAAATLDSYLGVLRRIDGDLEAGLTCACTDELQDWIFTDEHGPATRALYRAAVAGFFAWATDPDEPRLDYNPARRIPAVHVQPGRPRPVPARQLAAILTGAARPYYVWFVAASHAGARCVEIAQLDRDDITQEETLLHGKGGRSRLVPTHPLVWQLAQELPAGLVAAGLNRKQVSLRGNAHLDRLDVPAVTMHRLRHTFLTSAYDACKDIRAVQRLAGHASVSTTQIYVEAREDVMRLAVAGLPVVA